MRNRIKGKHAQELVVFQRCKDEIQLVSLGYTEVCLSGSDLHEKAVGW